MRTKEQLVVFHGPTNSILTEDGKYFCPNCHAFVHQYLEDDCEKEVPFKSYEEMKRYLERREELPFTGNFQFVSGDIVYVNYNEDNRRSHSALVLGVGQGNVWLIQRTDTGTSLSIQTFSAFYSDRVKNNETIFIYRDRD